MSDQQQKLSLPDPETKVSYVPWDVFVREAMKSIRKRSRIIFTLGIVVYGGGTGAILVYIPDKGLALVLQMFLFQLCVVYMAVLEIFPCIRGAFTVTLESSERSIPVFEDLGRSARSLEKKAEEYRGRDIVAEMKEEVRAGIREIKEELRPKKLQWTPPDLLKEPDSLLDDPPQEVDVKADTRILPAVDRAVVLGEDGNGKIPVPRPGVPER